MSKTLVIVESPAKARKIQGYLGSNYIVKASFGHIRGLKRSLKAIDTENGFKPTYEILKDKQKVVNEFNQKKQIEFGEFFKKITPIIEQYVSEKKIDIVLDKKNVFVASKKKDITQEIINIIDSKIK